jgi:ABC-2 type transport system permease protein
MVSILAIALKEMKHTYRDVRAMAFMLAFPILLMFVLGTALSNVFDSKIQISNIHVLYKDEAGQVLSQSFKNFEELAGKSGIHFTRAPLHTDGQKEVRQNNYDSYVELKDNTISVYESTRNSVEGSIVQGIVTAFADKYNIAEAVAKIKPDQVNQVLADNGKDDYIKTVSLHSPKQPGSMDYYAIAMTTMIALYAAIGGASLIRGERTRNTADRLLAAPIRKGEIFLGKILGSLMINAICLILVVLFSKYVFKAYWGSHLGIVLLILLTESFLAVSFGLGVSYLTKTGQSARTIIMIGVQVASFFGGAYFKVDGLIPSFSPLTWANQAITKIIYSNDLVAALPVIGLNLGIAIIMLMIAVISFRRKEGL